MRRRTEGLSPVEVLIVALAVAARSLRPVSQAGPDGIGGFPKRETRRLGAPAKFLATKGLSGSGGGLILWVCLAGVAQW